MTRVRQLLARLRGVLGQKQLDERLDEEVAFHLDKLTERFVREGMSQHDARAAARRTFGRVDAVKETYRHQRGIPVIETLIRDARYAVRSLVRSPMFTFTALGSLTLGIGANSAIFSVINTALLRPLPYPEPERLVQVVRQFEDWDGWTMDRQRFQAVQENSTVFSSLAALASPTGLNLVTGNEAEYLTALPVSYEYFEVIGVAPTLGRTFLPEEDVAGGADVVVLSYDVWTRVMNGDPSVIGQTATLSEVPHTIVGVMPADFQAIPNTDLWFPLRPATNGQGGGYNYSVVGRLTPNVALPQAQAEMEAIARGVNEVDPGEMSDGEALGARSYTTLITGNLRAPLFILLGAVGLVLLIACANVANLMLARAINREREMAVRVALGASRRRLIGQLLTESVILSTIAGVVGLVLAGWAAPLLLALSPAASPWREVSLDVTVVAVTFGAAGLTGVLFGLVPAMTVSGSALAALRDDGTRSSGSGRVSWLRQILITFEIAVAVVLLVGATLLIKSFVNLRSVELGFEPDNVLTAQMSLTGERYTDPTTVHQHYSTGIDRLERVPGVEAAAVVSGLPVEFGLNLPIEILSSTENAGSRSRQTDYRYVTPDYFSVMGMDLVSGRPFDQRDAAGTQPVAIVNEEFARAYLDAAPPVGQRIRIVGSWGKPEGMEVVGVVGNMQEQGLGGRSIAIVYVPVVQAEPNAIATTHYYFPISWVIRIRPTAQGVSDQVREALRVLDPRTPVSRVRTMNEIISSSLSDQRFQTVILSLFSLVAVVLAAAGIYGIMAYTVSSRQREFGIRIALGATSPRIIGSVLRHGLMIGAVGAVLGLVGAFALGRTLDAFVFGISPTDPNTMITVGLALLVIAAGSGILPAVRALRRDPVRTLRTE
jgi:predicted permease